MVRDKKIQIYKKGDREKDDDGYPVEDWILFADRLWAHIKDLRGSLFYASNAENRKKTIICNISNKKGIEEGMRVHFNNEFYKIIRVYKGSYKGEGINLDCELIEGVNS